MDSLPRKPRKKSCLGCPLKGQRNSEWLLPTVYTPDPEGHVDILFVLDSPDYQANETKSLKNHSHVAFINKWLKKGLSRRGKVRKLGRGIAFTSATRCIPLDKKKSKRKPESEELNRCIDYTTRDMAELAPKLTVLLGSSAIHSMFPHAGGATASAGTVEEDPLGNLIFFAYSPAFVELSNDPEVLREWKKQVIRILELAGWVKDKHAPKSRGVVIEVGDDFEVSGDYPTCAEEVKSIYIDDVEKVFKLAKKMQSLPKGAVICSDTEANNLFRAFDNKMLSVQFGWDGKSGYVVPYHHRKSPFNADDKKAIYDCMQDLFTTRTKNGGLWCFANAAYDMHQFRREFECELLSMDNVDVSQVAHLLDENRLQGTRDPECYYQGKRGLSLAVLSEVYLGVVLSSEDKRERASIRRWPMKRFVPYAAGDVVWPWQILQKQLLQADDQDYRRPLLRLIRFLLSPANLLVVEMEQNGFPVDLEHTRRIRGAASPLIAEKKRLMGLLSKTRGGKKANKIINGRAARGNHYLFGEPPFSLKPSKANHRETLFLDVLRYKPLTFTEQGAPQINSEFYKEYGVWDDNDEPQNEAAIISDWVGVDKLLSSFVKNFYALVDPDRGHPDMVWDCRVRPSIRLAATTSGRPAIKNPAMQQIPRATDSYRKDVKDMFVSEEGKVLILADLKANEVRWGAINAQAKILGNLFQDGLKAVKRFRKFADSLEGTDKRAYQEWLRLAEVKELSGKQKRTKIKIERRPKMKKLLKLAEEASLRGDIHKQTASTFYSVPLKEVSKGLRQDTKAVIFGHIAARGPKAISEQIGKSIDETKALLRDFDRKFPGLAKHLNDNARLAESRGYTEGPQGRRRRFARAVWSDPEEWVQAKARRQARNNGIQGSASDACLVAGFQLLDYIRKNDKSWKLLNMVHDALYIEVPVSELPAALEAVELSLTDWTMEWMSEKFGINFVAPLEADVDAGLSWGTYVTWNGTQPHIDVVMEWVKAQHTKKWGWDGVDESMRPDRSGEVQSVML